MKEEIMELLKSRARLVERISGNVAEMEQQLKYVQPQIEKIDYLVELFTNKRD